MNYPEAPIKLTDRIFADTIKKYPLMVVLFHQDIEYTFGNPLPILEQMAEKYAGKIVFGILNIKKNQKTALHYDITSTTAILIFKNQRLVGYLKNNITRQELEDRIDLYM